MAAEKRAIDIASRHGIVELAQLLDVGLSKDAVRRRVDSGWLTRLHPAVFSIGEPSELGRVDAALRACGQDATATAWSAAAMDELLPYPAAVHVANRRGGPRPKAVEVSQPRIARDWHLRHGLRCTTPAETLLALAASDYGDARDATDRAFVLRRTTTERLTVFLEANRGRRGVAVLRDIVEGPRTRSQLERLFLRLLRDARLPLPLANVRVNGHLVDFHWPDHRLVVETDGWASHGRRSQWERDRVRDLHLFGADVQTLRVTYLQLTRTPLEVAAALGSRLLTTPRPSASAPLRGTAAS